MNKDIYEIYRACRLCGVGAGYKMPIIQSIIDLEEEVELKQKIKDCLQIEVNLHDRMPPLICELCVDKLNDFYEFRKMCQETNKNTRLRLGLPLQTLQNTAEPDCILGVTEPLNSDSDEAEPLVRHQPRKPASSAKIKEPDVKVKVENSSIEVSRSPSPCERRQTRPKRDPSPKRVTRQKRTDDMVFTELQDCPLSKSSSVRTKPGPKSVLKSRERQKEAEKKTPDDESDDNSLLVVRQKRPREIVLETIPAFKRTKLSSEPAKTEKSSRPGPKSSKESPKPTPPQKPPPKAGPKSRMRDSSPALKTQKTEPPVTKSRRSVSQEPTPKTKNSATVAASKKSRTEVLPVPASKAKKGESSSVPPSKTKKRDVSSPAPKSRKQREASPKASENATDKASLECNICGIKAKAIQGLMSHMKVHVPTFTNPKYACNACETWFPNGLLAAGHHRKHGAGMAYTCGRCYDDFRSDGDYELHFVRNQCLPTYEAPDVKCDECWKMFPTYKLLEDHRCAGEGARPGGKCSKCKRTYNTQKSLTLHEMRCTAKKKVESEAPEPETSNTLPPAQVRLVRCDALLAPSGGLYRVGGLSTKFGLDRNCTYPYLSAGRIKSEPATVFDHMVAINDEIKQEYLNQDYDNNDDIDNKEDNDAEINNDVVHWDSDNESDDNMSNSSKSVNSLSTISLKTLFSPKCLGTVPRKKRKVKSEVESDSILTIHFNEDTRSNINNIIDNFVKESINSDSYDSDSILDKNVDRKTDSADLFDSVALSDIVNATVQKEINKPDEEFNRTETDIDSDRISNTNNSNIEDVNKIETNETNEQSTVTKENERINKLNENIEITNSQTNSDENIKPESLEDCADSKTSENNGVNTESTDTVHQNNDISSSPKNGHIVRNKVVGEEESPPIEDKVENGNAQTNIENMDIDKEPERNIEDVSKVVDSSDIEMTEQTIEKQTNNKNEDDAKNDSQSSATSKTDDENIKKVEHEHHETDDKVNEGGDTSFAVNGETNDNDNSFSAVYDEANENDTSSYATDNKPIKNDNSSNVENDNSNENDLSYVKDDATNNSNNILTSTKTDEVKNQDRNAGPHLVDSKDSLITENELFENDNVHSADKFNINYLDDEEKLLMAELDAQIGENQPESTVGKNSGVIGKNSNATGKNSVMIGENSDVAGENTAMIGESCGMIAENSSVINNNSGVICENSSVTGENSGLTGENSGVIGENSALTGENSENSGVTGENSGVTGENSRANVDSAKLGSDYHSVGIANESVSEKSDNLASLMEQDDMKSLDLDSISDEEFNFDI